MSGSTVSVLRRRPADILTKDRALECLIVADTMDGDELAMHPSEPDRLHVLPRHQEAIYVAGNGAAGHRVVSHIGRIDGAD